MRRLLRRCLEKDRRERLQAIGDARLDIRDAMSGSTDVVSQTTPAKRRLHPAFISAIIVAPLLAGAAVWFAKPSPSSPGEVTRSLLAIEPFDQRPNIAIREVRRGDRTSLALTPDGRTLVIRTLGPRTEQLYVRRLDSLDTKPVDGTEGGEPHALTKLGTDEYRHSLPHKLPDGSILFVITKAAFRWDHAQIVVRDRAGKQKLIVDNGADPRYIATAHIVFVRAATLMAVPFDAERLDVTGRPVALAEDVMQAINTGNTGAECGAAQIAISRDGTLVYATGGITPDPVRTISWIDAKTGAATPLNVPDLPYIAPRLSPDGTRVAVTSLANGNRRVWVHDLIRGGLNPPGGNGVCCARQVSTK